MSTEKQKAIEMTPQIVIKNEDGSEKKITLRTTLIKDINMATSIAATKCQDPKVMPLIMQQELLKLVLVDVDGKVPTGTEREDLDGLFTVSEYMTLLEYVQSVMGKSQVVRTSFVKSSGAK